MSIPDFVQLALSFEGTFEKPHFDRRAFKVENKRIFATLQESTHTANIKLSTEEQQVFCEYGPAIYPVPNKWGEQGWTTIDLAELDENLVLEMLNSAYNQLFEK